MRWYLGISALLFVVAFPAAHADLQDRLNSRWRGAWVIVNAELYSNCDSTYTNNRVNGDLIRGIGRVTLSTGELARVHKVDVKRRRIDILLDLNESILIEYQDGPFTLYREASCRVELLVDTGGQRTKKLGTGDIEALFAPWLERYTRQTQAEHSANWNRRARQAYPENYEQTLAEYRIWQVEQHNQLVEERINDSIEQASQLLVAVSENGDFGVIQTFIPVDADGNAITEGESGGLAFDGTDLWLTTRWAVDENAVTAPPEPCVEPPRGATVYGRWRRAIVSRPR